MELYSGLRHYSLRSLAFGLDHLLDSLRSFDIRLRDPEMKALPTTAYASC